MVEFSPAEVVVKFLQAQVGLLTGWTFTVQAVPDEGDQHVTVSDTAGVLDGRYMRSGENVYHPGVQVRVRARNHPVGFTMCVKLLTALEAARSARVIMVPASVTPPLFEKAVRLHAFSLSSPPTPIGVEERTRRHLFVFNGTVTLTKDTP